MPRPQLQLTGNEPKDVPIKDRRIVGVANDADYEGLEFHRCEFAKLKQCDGLLFSRAKFIDVEFIDCELIDCEFHNVRFVNCKIKGVAFRDCIFRDAVGAKIEVTAIDDNSPTKFLNCCMEGAELRNSSWKNVVFESPPQTTAGREELFEKADLRGARFVDCTFLESNLCHCKLDNRTSFKDCTLTNVDTTGVDLKLIAGITPEQADQLIIKRRRKYWENYFNTSKIKWPVKPSNSAGYRKLSKRWYEVCKVAAKRLIAALSYCIVRAFWALSNDGTSTLRVMMVLFFAWMAFTIGSLICWGNVELMQGVWSIQDGCGCREESPPLDAFLRSASHSITTMMTGESEGYRPNLSGGHILYVAEIVMGYIILFALATRLQISFSETP